MTELNCFWEGLSKWWTCTCGTFSLPKKIVHNSTSTSRALVPIWHDSGVEFSQGLRQYGWPMSHVMLTLARSLLMERALQFTRPQIIQACECSRFFNSLTKGRNQLWPGATSQDYPVIKANDAAAAVAETHMKLNQGLVLKKTINWQRSLLSQTLLTHYGTSVSHHVFFHQVENNPDWWGKY